MKTRRRTILKVMCLLAAGAAVNVAVAWGLVCWGADGNAFRVGVRFLKLPQDESWYRPVPPNWPIPTERGMVGLRGRTNIYTSITLDREVFSPFHFSQMIVQAGWPFRAMESEVRVVQPNAGATFENIADIGEVPKWLVPKENIGRRIPRRPIAFGFAINTVFYAGVLWVLCCGPFALRRMIRRRRGQCAHCAYPIGQNERCTECGTPYPALSRSRRS